jgi:hypothetical protein
MTTLKFARIKARILAKLRVSAGALITINKINATFGVKAIGQLLELFKRALPATGMKLTPGRVRVILHFIKECKRIHLSQGMKGLVIFLKVNSVLVQQSIGGFVLKDITPVGCRVSRCKSGLPRLILPADRANFRLGDYRVIKFYLTLFNLYRVLEFPGKLKLNTITDGFKGQWKSHVMVELLSYIPDYINLVRSLSGPSRLQTLGISPRGMFKSGPDGGTGHVVTHPLSLALQAIRLRQLGLAANIEYFIKYYSRHTEVWLADLITPFVDASNLWPLNLLPILKDMPIGKLGLKEEAAGKVRVFAMVDAWTQWVLEPLHKELFRILDCFPTDGTHDQLKPVLKYQKWPSAYSLDLSAATDRLPAVIQQKLLSALYGQEFADNWYKLLVDREYHAFSKKYHLDTRLRYAVGQPMGALSSWAMLAFTHHFLVQAAAWMSGVTQRGKLFTDYGVLGDDLVIGNQLVKEKYLLIISTIGVECGIAKSLLSSSGIAIEFAKTTFYKGFNVSAVPLLELCVSQLALPDAIQFGKKYHLTFPQLLKTLGYGKGVLSTLNSHIGTMNSRVRALLIGYLHPTNEDEAKDLLLNGNPFIESQLLGEILASMRDEVVASIEAHIDRAYAPLDQRGKAIKAIGQKSLDLGLSLFPDTSTLDLDKHRLYGVKFFLEGLALLTLGPAVEARGDLFVKIRSRASEALVSESVFSIWSDTLNVLKQISLLGPFNVEFVRDVEKLPSRFFQTSTNARLWVLFTKSLQKAIKAKVKVPVTTHGQSEK